MSYILDSTTLKRPTNMIEDNSTQVAQIRTLDGGVSRDYFGSNKRVWTLFYQLTQVSDYNVIKAIYDSHLSTGNTKTWEVTESNYTIPETNVHIDLNVRRFFTRGGDYLSEFELVLTEA